MVLMHFDDYDAAMHRLDEQLYGGEPDEPDWAWYDRPLTPRQRRRAAHREWQRRDRASRAGQSPASDVVRVARAPFRPGARRLAAPFPVLARAACLGGLVARAFDFAPTSHLLRIELHTGAIEMTDLLSPEDVDTGPGELTTNIAPYLAGLRPPLRRAESEATRTGEIPLYEPKTMAVVDGAAERERLAVGETLVLPLDAAPVVPRHAAPTVYLPEPEPRRERGYRGRRRMAEPLDPRWAWVAIGFGGTAALEAVFLLMALAVTR